MSLLGSLAIKLAARWDERHPVFYAADTAAFTVRDGSWHVLLIERGWDPHRGKLAFPGGHVDPHETARDAAARELTEETGLIAPPRVLLDQVGVFDHPGRDARGRYVSVCYGVILHDAPDPVAADDAAAADWLPLRLALRMAGRDAFAFDHAAMLHAAVHHFDLDGIAREGR